jgi:hypothetical protein
VVPQGIDYAQADGTVIALLPAWTDAAFFHDYCALGKITFLRNRLVFRAVCKGAHAPFASMIVEWSPQTLRSGPVLDARLGVPRRGQSPLSKPS